MLTNPAGQWGAIEVSVVYADPGFLQNARDDNGVLSKHYPTAHAWIASGFGSDSRVRGTTQIIVKRGQGERQTPPGYSGTGNVVVELLLGYRYWRFGAAGDQVEHTGRVSCNPDEAVQLVGT